MKSIIAYVLCIIVAPLLSTVTSLISLLLLKSRKFSPFAQLIGWIDGISGGVLQVWIISLIFQWITNSHPHFIFLIVFIIFEFFVLNEKINPGPLKNGLLFGNVFGLILGWLIFI